MSKENRFKIYKQPKRKEQYTSKLQCVSSFAHFASSSDALKDSGFNILFTLQKNIMIL